MPTYDYECKKCSKRFELKKHFNDDIAAQCPDCGSDCRRIFSPTPIIFKGSGFYVTDYSSSSRMQASGESKPGETKPAESKPDKVSANQKSESK